MTTSERLHSAVLAAIADPDPALKSATNPRWKFLIHRVRVFLDGEDVTARCKAFSIPGTTVELYAEDGRGRRVIVASCACGTMTRGEKVAAGNHGSECRVCRQPYEWAPLIVTRMGRVDVVPASGFTPSSEGPKEADGPA